MSITDGTVLKVVATLVWTWGGVNQNVFNAVVTGAGAPWDEDDIVDDALVWISQMYTNLNSLWHLGLTGSTIQVYEYDPVDDDWDEVGSLPWSFTPLGSGHANPEGCAALINAKSSDPDVSGKKYLGGTTEDQGSNGIWGGGTLTAIANFAADWGAQFIGTASAADWAPVIWSVVNGAALLMSEDYIIPTIVAYQRRRKRGVGV